jgi:DNA ligase-1
MSGEPATQFTDDTVADIYDTIAKRDLTGNAARLWLANLYHDLAEDWEKELLTLLIQRDVQAGISKGTINKVWPGLITDVPYMRCCLPSAVDLASWPWKRGVYSQIKADGQYANISHLASGAVTIETRAGSPFPLEYFKDLVAEIQAAIPKGMQIHGELLMLDPQGKIMPREKGNGMFNSLQQGGELEPGYQPVYHAWDMIPVEEAKVKNKYLVAYETRFQALEGYIGKGLKHLQLIEYKIVHSLAEAYRHAKEAMEAGLEGTVDKHPDGPWEDSDGSKYQVKLKLEVDVEVRVVGFKAADTKSKNKDLFGSLMCESECGKLRVNVSGIKDAKRKELFDRKEQILGKLIITMRCNGLMEPSDDTDGYWSVFLPRFIEERPDRDTADTLERMKQIQQSAIELGSIADKR